MEWGGVGGGGGRKSAAKGSLITGYRSHENVHKTNVRVYVFYVCFPSNLTLIEWRNIQTLYCAFAQALSCHRLISSQDKSSQVPREKAQLAGSMEFELTSHYVSLSFELMKFSP